MFSLCLLGTPQSLAKRAKAMSCSFANTPCGVDFSFPLVTFQIFHAGHIHMYILQQSAVINPFWKFIDIFLRPAYYNSTRQVTAYVCCVCLFQRWNIRECAGTHCLIELSGGVVQWNLKPTQANCHNDNLPKENAQKRGKLWIYYNNARRNLS